MEDNSSESMLLAAFSRMHGIAVETASDGQNALDYLKSHDRPDVMLLDMRMLRAVMDLPPSKRFEKTPLTMD